MEKIFFKLCGLSTLTVLACGGKQQVMAQKAQPNILFIVAEDASPDLGCYGNKIVRTPHIDKLASEGVLFKNAYTTYSVSSPSRGSIFTGLYSHQNGQFGLATHKYEMFPNIKTLPTYMKEVGYRTGCLGKIHVNPEKNVAFDVWKNRGANFAKKNLPSYAKYAAEFFTASEQPFLMMVNFPDSHFPIQREVEGRPIVKIEPEDIKEGLSFVGANSENIRKNTANYYNCMNRLDECVGMLLEALEKSGKAKETIIVFISDHGAQFSRGKTTNYEAGLKIPFIIKWPSLIEGGSTKDELVSVVDLLPTFISIAGGEESEKLPGEDILSLWTEKDKEWRTHLFAGGMGCAPSYHYPKRSVRDERFKLILNTNDGINPSYVHYEAATGHHVAGAQPEEIENAPEYVQKSYVLWKKPPRYELYDLKKDPNEWYNLAEKSKYAKILNELKAKIYDWRLETTDMILAPDLLQKLNQEMDSLITNKVNYKSKGFQYGYVKYLEPNIDVLKEYLNKD